MLHSIGTTLINHAPKSLLLCPGKTESIGRILKFTPWLCDFICISANISLCYYCFADTRIGFERVIYSVLENASFVRLLTRAFTDSGVLTEDVDVRFNTSDGSAVGGWRCTA